MHRRFAALLLLLCLPAAAGASGYRIPETSFRSTALAGAYVAGADAADAAYYNPANLLRLEPEGQWETGLQWIALPAVEFRGLVGAAAADGASRSEAIGIPYFHYVAPKRGDAWRFGVSLAAPAGLAKRWETPVQRAFAEKYALEVAELNPSVAWRGDGRWRFGAGLRLVSSKGEVGATHPAGAYAFTIEGDGLDAGWNLAAAYRAAPDVDLALTYRSEVHLDLAGTNRGRLFLPAPVNALRSFDTATKVRLPLPAACDLGVAWRAGRTRYEFVVERVLWSAYRTLDFAYADPVVEAALGAPKAKNWKDTTVFRLGARRPLDAKWTLYGGLVFDPTPVPDATISFDLPDADALALSLGAVKKVREDLEVGFAACYVEKKERFVAPGANLGGIAGRFSGGGAMLCNLTARYRF